MAKSKKQNQNSQPTIMIPAAASNMAKSKNQNSQPTIMISAASTSSQMPKANNRKRPYPQQQEANMQKLIPFTEIEWKYVQKKFMSEDEEDLKQLCGIMNMWICRMCHDTPVFIGITELMLRALVLEQKYNKMPDHTLLLLDNTDVGLIYGSVIIRFINYVNEICQPEGDKKISIAAAVKKMGIPSWIVSIRHQATHEQMPLMNMMKEAIKFCRTWLWRQHWSKPLTDAVKQILPEIYEEEQKKQKSTMGNRMLFAIQNFRDWRKKFPSLDELHATNAQQRSPNQAPDRCRQLLEPLLDNHAEEFITFFALHCLTIKIGVDREILKEKNDLLEELNRSVFSKQKHIDKITPYEQKYYRPIFILMNEKGCLQGLLMEIVRLVAFQSKFETESEYSSRCHLSGWADILLSVYILNDSANISNQNWLSILRNIVLAPQFFRDEHIKNLVRRDFISERHQRRLVKLFKIINPKFDDDGQNNDEISHNQSSIMDCSMRSVKTLADLQNKIRREEVADHTFLHDPLTMEGDWSLASPDELGAMGLTSDQKAETLCLALGTDLYVF